MAKSTPKIETLKVWRLSLKTKIAEKKHEDASDKGITKTYINAKNSN